MKFEFTLSDGRTIKGVYELMTISKYYEAACSAEFIQDDLRCPIPDKIALDMGYETRRLMDKTEYPNEKETIKEFVYPKAERNVAGWLSMHKRACERFKRHFNVDIENYFDVSFRAMLCWIYEHKQLAEDFENHFSKIQIV